MTVFNWLGAVAMCLPKSTLKSVLYHMMAPIIREREIVQQGGENHPMKSLVVEVCGIFKKKVGMETYSKEVIRINAKLAEKRTERKNKIAQEV